MLILKKHKFIIAVIAAIVLSILLFRQCEKTRKIQKEAHSITNFLNDTINHYRNEKGQWAAEKQALQGGKAALEVLLSKQIDSTGQLKDLVKKFRNVDAAGNITTITKIDTISIPYEVPVPCEFHRDWTKQNPLYSISGTSTHLGNTINTIEIPATISFGIGDKKTGFFSTEYRIEAVVNNEYVKITGLDAYSLKVPKPRFSVGIFAGYGLGKDGLSPIVGVGVGYSLFSF